MASTSALIANLANLTLDDCFRIRAPSLSLQTATVDISQVGDEPGLRFRFTALKSDLPLVLSKNLQNRKYLAQGACSQVTVVNYRGRLVAVKRILKTSLLQDGEVLPIGPSVGFWN